MELLEKYASDWDLSNLIKLTSTFTSDLFLADSKFGKVVLKILNDVGIEDESSLIAIKQNR